VVLSDSIVIDDWDVSTFETLSGEVEAHVYAGETVTWTYNDTLYNVVEFSNEDDYENCALTNSTTVDTDGSYILEAWPIPQAYGSRFFASGVETDCADGKKIKLVVKPKQFEGNKKKSCGGYAPENATTITGKFAKSIGLCMVKCKNTQDCFGFEWRSAKNKIDSQCILFDTYPTATGPAVIPGFKKVACMSVKYDNTVED
jgi:hypothetical protein